LKNILFIVDAGDKIGLGHYKRCLELKNKSHHGANSIFLTQSKEVLLLNKNIPTYITSKEDSIEKKKSQVEKIVLRHDVDVIICDINNKDALDNKNDYISFIEAISKLKTVLVSFEDFIIHDVCSDVVIIPYFGAEEI
jgi:spore coat polysaccharide biosynthesis predicted glycosyltransferase SpsG